MREHISRSKRIEAACDLDPQFLGFVSQISENSRERSVVIRRKTADGSVMVIVTGPADHEVALPDSAQAASFRFGHLFAGHTEFTELPRRQHLEHSSSMNQIRNKCNEKRSNGIKPHIQHWVIGFRRVWRGCSPVLGRPRAAERSPGQLHRETG
ncbi:hypothetical protein [Brevibacterium epidermidis]|uniref:hypothetical protein n=1 Tax=Brevibacterium epidermidis TaxID=1698 RepID=UPI0012ED407B|nr:hypothetical protein [Brevibacterium epidermidis]